MITDYQNTLADNQTLIGTNADVVVSTNAIALEGSTTAITDTLGNTPIKDLGRAELVQLLVQITTTVVGASSTITFSLCTSTNADKSTGLVVIQSTAAIGVASLTAGYQFRLDIPPGLPSTATHLFVRYTIGGANTTAGAYSAFIVAAKQTNGYAI
jgi:hypothetical protein